MECPRTPWIYSTTVRSTDCLLIINVYPLMALVMLSRVGRNSPQRRMPQHISEAATLTFFLPISSCFIQQILFTTSSQDTLSLASKAELQTQQINKRNADWKTPPASAYQVALAATPCNANKVFLHGLQMISCVICPIAEENHFRSSNRLPFHRVKTDHCC